MDVDGLGLIVDGCGMVFVDGGLGGWVSGDFIWCGVDE